MDETKNVNRTIEWPATLTGSLDEPVVLEQNGEPKAVLMSIKDYRRYQAILARQEYISARQARRAANRAVFGDLVGCPLSCDEPIWIPQPEPHWRVPYRLFDGTLMVVVDVDAYTGIALFTEQERAALLERVRQAAILNDPT
jgi:hypothetical protein